MSSARVDVTRVTRSPREEFSCDSRGGDARHARANAANAALGTQIDNPLTPDEWIARLATLPLIDQPGEGFHYGHSTDLLGFLLARLEGFAPLGMRDTGFAVPPEKRHRRAGWCGFDDEGRLSALSAAPGGHALAERPEGMTFESGGQGLWSTLEDYLVFARMLIGDNVSGAPLLRRETLALMTSNRGSARSQTEPPRHLSLLPEKGPRPAPTTSRVERACRRARFSGNPRSVGTAAARAAIRGRSRRKQTCGWT